MKNSKDEIFFITGAVADGLFDLVPEGSIDKDYELYTEQEIVVTKEL